MRTKLFIGSSVESLPIAHAIQEELEHTAEPTVWTQGIFGTSQSNLASLLAATEQFDAAIFVFSPDDVTIMRNQSVSVARDNVVFELGLFMGRLGSEKVFIVLPRDIPSLRLPTDLLGITPATYDPNRQDKNLRAALGPACSKIRARLPVRTSAPDEKRPSTVSDDGALLILEGWLNKLPSTRYKDAIRTATIDAETKLPTGTSERLIAQAVATVGGGFRLKGPNSGVVIIWFEVPRIDPPRNPYGGF